MKTKDDFLFVNEDFLNLPEDEQYNQAKIAYMELIKNKSFRKFWFVVFTQGVTVGYVDDTNDIKEGIKIGKIKN